MGPLSSSPGNQASSKGATLDRQPSGPARENGADGLGAHQAAINSCPESWLSPGTSEGSAISSPRPQPWGHRSPTPGATQARGQGPRYQLTESSRAFCGPVQGRNAASRPLPYPGPNPASHPTCPTKHILRERMPLLPHATPIWTL